ncbi:MAG: nucleoid-associated protein [Oscillospiraceae bacterium]|nr:nucleoid-associated protein [Oscillospiraceae bacterium]
MIITVKKAILHILDAVSGVTVYSDEEIDVSNESICAFIIKHIEKIYDEPGAREGEFNDASGFKYHLSEYIKGETGFCKFTQFVSEKLYDGISSAEKSMSCDLIIEECVINEKEVTAVLKCDNKPGYTHQVFQENGAIRNEIINHYAILPSPSGTISEYAFIDMNDFKIKCKGKKVNIDGESLDIMADVMLECVYDISSKESFNAMNKIAKKISEDNGADSIETSAKIKKFVTESISEADEYIEPVEFADAVFDNSPAMRKEFVEKTREASVPEKVKMNDYIGKKATKNIKIVTDTGIEISFPAEYYRDEEHISIINNPDGTLRIQINNIGEITNKL